MTDQQGLLDVPQLLGQVHVVVVGVLEPLHLIPQGVHLPLTVGPAGLEVGNLIDQLALLEDGHHQFLGFDVGIYLPLPGGVRVKELQGLFKVDLLVVDADQVGLRLAGVPGAAAVHLLEVGGGDLGGVLADFDFGDDVPLVVLDGHQLVYSAEHRLAAGGNQPLAHAEGVNAGPLAHQVPDNILVQGVGAEKVEKSKWSDTWYSRFW